MYRFLPFLLLLACSKEPQGYQVSFPSVVKDTVIVNPYVGLGDTRVLVLRVGSGTVQMTVHNYLRWVDVYEYNQPWSCAHLSGDACPRGGKVDFGRRLIKSDCLTIKY